MTNKTYVVFATKGQKQDPMLEDSYDLALLIAADMLKGGTKRSEVFEVTPTSYKRVAVRVA